MDLISRQATLDWLKNEWNGMVTSLFDGIKALPPAQPDTCEDAVSRQRLLSDLKELAAVWKKYPVMAEQIKGVEAAIGYVEAIPSVKPDSKELSPTHKALDTISRQAAIDALDKRFDNVPMEQTAEILKLRKDLRELPSIQPKTNCSEIPNNSDCISRRAAITAIQKAYADTEGGTDKCAVWKNVGLTNALHIMQDLPSAQPDIIRCKDCKYQDEGYRRISVKWLPCMDIRPGSNWYCGSAERREE